jgi:hypothetical protein
VDKINGLPFVRAYWVVPGRVAAGNYPGDRNAEEAASKLAGLLESGLNTVINLMPVDESDRDGEPFVPYEDQFAEIAAANQTEVTCLRYPIADLSVPSPQQMRLILDAIDQSLAGWYWPDGDGRWLFPDSPQPGVGRIGPGTPGAAAQRYTWGRGGLA